MNIYKNCPTFENEKFILRLTELNDCEDLLQVYSDKKALPYFNSDNCHGDDFYYASADRMLQAINFWIEAYSKGWFVRWSIYDKNINKVVGTIEEFHRDSDDFYTDCGLLRLDLRSDFEIKEKIEDILSLIVRPSFEIFGSEIVATKARPFAEERIQALKNLGFTARDEKLKGFDGTLYGDYFVLEK